MDDNIMKSRVFMRGNVKNAKAEELLALIKAEREVEEIGIKNEVPSRLTKRPLLPAIKVEEVKGVYEAHRGALIPETLASFIQNIPVRDTNSKFVWRDSWGLEDTDVNSSWKTRNNRRLRSESFSAISKDYLPNNNSSLEITPKNLPPLLSRRSSKERCERPGCPEPPVTPSFEMNSHGTEYDG